MSAVRPITKILLDGGDPEETAHIRNRLGFLDGQTTNPTFVAQNPEVQQMIASGRKLTRKEQKEEYKAIVQRFSPLVDTAGVSIEVFADFDTSAEQMLAQGKRCSLGSRTPISSIPASGRDSGQQRCRSNVACA